MLRRVTSHALHLVGEVLLGLLVLAALGTGGLAWLLSRGPIDITGLLQRAHPIFTAQGAHLRIGGAALAWEGFTTANRPLDIRLRDVDVLADHSGIAVQISQARVYLAVAPLLIGRLMPRDLLIDGARLAIRLPQQGAITPATPPPAAAPRPDQMAGATLLLNRFLGQARAISLPPWLAALHRVRIADAAVTFMDPTHGLTLSATHVSLAATRQHEDTQNQGIAGVGRLDLAIGEAHTHLDAAASIQPNGTHLTAHATPIDPASLARATPMLSFLAGIALPTELSLAASLDRHLTPQSLQLDLHSSAGHILAGQGSVGIASAAASLTLRPGQARLTGLRIALAALPGAAAGAPAPPVLTGDADAAPHATTILAHLNLAVDHLALRDLGSYWPAGTGGGSRGWLVKNLVAGHAHDATLHATLSIPTNFTAPTLMALSGGLRADDVTLTWLRPIPPLTGGQVVLAIQSPDALLVTMNGAHQGALSLTDGATIHISGLQQRHQVGDIDLHLSGALADALALLNHPRLNLLARSQLPIIDPAGQAHAHLTLHVPLEARVTMADIPITGNADLTGVHMGKIAGGYDLDQGQLALNVNNDGLALKGHGDLAGIPSALTLDMDFRDGPPDEVLLRATATARATSAELAQAGLPGFATRILSGGAASLQLAYESRRDDRASLHIAAALAQAALATPFGWSKPIGPAASIAARLMLDHGRLTGIQDLHAEGPDLDIQSHTETTHDHGHALSLTVLHLGRTRAHGSIDFPGSATAPLIVTLTGPTLDLAAYLDDSAKHPPKPERDTTDADGDTPGQPWRADLHFTQLRLSAAKTLSPFSLSAADDGRRITRAEVRAGAELAVSITQDAGGRHLDVRVPDAGIVLRALGIADNIAGGTLDMTGQYNDRQSPTRLSGTARLSQFNLRDAPAIGRLMQAMTLYGLTDVLRGPGLHFSTLIAPFTWQSRILHLANARAFSPSLGITAQGDIDLRHHLANVTGTLVPAYFFNQLLGDLPIVGKIFSPEKGGGVFAARYAVHGRLADPTVTVNPLSALTPGFLREGFGLLDGKK